MSEEPNQKLIIAFLGRGMAHEVATALHEKLGLDAFHYGHGRGASLLHAIAAQDMPEVDILSVVVTAAQAEATFAFIYEAGQVDRAGGGLIAQLPLARAAATGLAMRPPEGATD